VPAVLWVAAAPGRVEPRSGELRVSSAVPGRIARVLVDRNQLVEAGELVIVLDDAEAQSRLSAAEAEAGARKRDRDNQTAEPPAGPRRPIAPATAAANAEANTAKTARDDLRKAEDNVAAAERVVYRARIDLDAAYIARADKKADAAKLITDAKAALLSAEDQLKKERDALGVALKVANIPTPNRFESSVTAAYSDIAVADALVQKHRIRAPISGTVLSVLVKLGETVTPSPEQPLVVVGDMSVLQVKAEVDERDVGKIKTGQTVFVRSTAYPSQDFEGKVSSLAPSLMAPRVGQRGPRRPTDVEVLEVTIDLARGVPLLPGMRVDAFFRKLD
jgi:HlyD family secretion protein